MTATFSLKEPPTILLKSLMGQMNSIILGKDNENKLALCCLLAHGHLLIEDTPGVGKTTLALALSKVMGLQFQRIQFTNDLLPADILGISIFEQGLPGMGGGKFNFHPGPIFSQVVLADEINRASPKTQSALLEAMEEQQVSMEGVTRPLPDPFFVIATQNSHKQAGTFPLPESQLDRFLMRISMGYPDEESEIALLAGKDRRVILHDLPTLVNAEILKGWQQQVQQVNTSMALLRYIVALTRHTRQHAQIKVGLSPRAALAIKKASQAWAFIEGRTGVLPEDVQQVFPAIAEHRIMAAEPSICKKILQQVPIP